MIDFQRHVFEMANLQYLPAFMNILQLKYTVNTFTVLRYKKYISGTFISLYSIILIHHFLVSAR